MDPSIDVGSLASEAAQVVVTGLVGSAGAALRARLVKLFTRGDADQEQQSAEVRKLDETGRQLETVSEEEREELSRQLEPNWQRRLMVFLEDHPDAAEELAALVQDFSNNDEDSPQRSGPMFASGGDNAVVIQSGRDTRFGGGLQR
ncbi:hypothetical protein [Saccharopolyspora elongata]|uniref:Uncharacterized protein n=1 Tax=Saccharopolyspora elongata TaxID=2530387 RepID=A0A4R4Y8Z6_9PSEU|nr:hypothetical protein [Saccharopolyspora elongata]TDD40843.1 hypothetical protein E1288_34425 [Saccharopolyspora elongata]